MAWTAPMTWSTGPIVTAAHLNEQIRDNETYLKAETDRIDNNLQIFPTTARAMDTAYQNTTTGLKMATLSIVHQCSTMDTAFVCVGSTSPGTHIARLRYSEIAEGAVYSNITVPVPPNFYFGVSTSVGAPSISAWVEMNLFYST